MKRDGVAPVLVDDSEDLVDLRVPRADEIAEHSERISHVTVGYTREHADDILVPLGRRADESAKYLLNLLRICLTILAVRGVRRLSHVAVERVVESPADHFFEVRRTDVEATIPISVENPTPIRGEELFLAQRDDRQGTAIDRELLRQKKYRILKPFAELVRVVEGDNHTQTLSRHRRQGSFDDLCVMWRKRSTGENQVWYTSGGSYLSSGTIASVPSNWDPACVGDFNFDTKPDILWRETTSGFGYVSVWLMNGTSHVGDVVLQAQPSQSWSIGACGDYNDDYRADIAWRNNTTGEDQMWLLSGSSFTAVAVQNAGSGWRMGGPR
jgi:hypothetical protein